MPRRSNTRAVVFIGLLLRASAIDALVADEGTVHWLRGSGEDLQIRLQGEVFESDGQPASNMQVTGRMNVEILNRSLKPKIDGHRFEIWIPVNQMQWNSMWLKAASAKGDRFAYQKLNAYELRQLAIDGIKLTLRTPTRRVIVKVIDKGQPVAGAVAKADLGYGIELRTRTDTDGIAHFDLLPLQELSGLMAWTEDFRVGGFGFDREPTRDPDANEHVVELSDCRDQKLRFIDEDGVPVPGVDFVIQMATPPPDYNYVGINEHSSMTTDSAGEVNYRWFPDWDKHHFYVDLKTDRWILDGDHQTAENTVLFKLKKSKIADRKRVTGQVGSDNSAVGGFYISLWSFQGEREDRCDVVRAFTEADGSFAIDVLPDATYCAYVLDSRWVSEMIDLIPYESALDQITHIDLSVSEGQEVEVTVASGPMQEPYPNLTISFRREHQFAWQENGETRHGSLGAQWWTTTDESGRAVTRTLPGKLKASIYSPLWKTEQTINVIRDEPAKIQLHRE